LVLYLCNLEKDAVCDIRSHITRAKEPIIFEIHPPLWRVLGTLFLGVKLTAHLHLVLRL